MPVNIALVDQEEMQEAQVVLATMVESEAISRALTLLEMNYGGLSVVEMA